MNGKLMVAIFHWKVNFSERKRDQKKLQFFANRCKAENGMWKKEHFDKKK